MTSAVYVGGDVDLFFGRVADIADPEIPGQAVDAEAPGLAQTNVIDGGVKTGGAHERVVRWKAGRGGGGR